MLSPAGIMKNCTDKKLADAVFISTADFQHALHAIQAVEAGCDAYVEKPFAETMEDNRAALKAIKASGKIVQIGSQRRSGANYMAANDFIRSGKFGNIVMVELTWNVNQPGRWRRPDLVPLLKEEDTDWKRFLMNRPEVPFDARKYLEFRLVLALFIRFTRSVDEPPDRHGTLVYRTATSPFSNCQWRNLYVEGWQKKLGYHYGSI